jgi:hypothetical protein
MFDRSYLRMDDGPKLVVLDGGVARTVSEILIHTKRGGNRKVTKIMKEQYMQGPVLAMLDMQAARGNIAHKFLQDDMDIHALHVEFGTPFPREFYCISKKSQTIEEVLEVEIRYLA